ncbi:hypothetical protein PG984_016621 [Apiospora sp. TS-2023a]
MKISTHPLFALLAVACGVCLASPTADQSLKRIRPTTEPSPCICDRYGAKCGGHVPYGYWTRRVLLAHEHEGVRLAGAPARSEAASPDLI